MKMFNVLCIWDEQNNNESKTKDSFMNCFSHFWHVGRVRAQTPLRLRMKSDMLGKPVQKDVQCLT